MLLQLGHYSQLPQMLEGIEPLNNKELVMVVQNNIL